MHASLRVAIVVGPSLDWKYLAVDSSVPSLHSWIQRVGVEFGGRNVTISSADMETGSEPQQQELLKLVRKLSRSLSPPLLYPSQVQRGRAKARGQTRR
jgi:hypothetical protein